jgi:endonuclease/exonuclease/phosphatase family metal-dependent hydrolase
MTYNLLYAFHERQGETMLFQEERARAAREVVVAEAPDVLGLTEAVYCGFRGRILRPDYPRLFGLPHLYAAGYEGEWAGCLLSRHPIVRAERVPLGSGEGRSDGAAQVSGIRAEIDCGGHRLHVDLVHPSPKVTEAERLAVVLPLLRSAGRPCILMGDLNALSDDDPYDHSVLAGQLRGNVAEPDALATRMLDRQLIAAVRAHGFRDTLPPERRVHTVPTRLPRPGARQGARIRIDYIFVSPELAVGHSAVVQSAAAERVSDHYPVVAVIELKA